MMKQIFNLQILFAWLIVAIAILLIGPLIVIDENRSELFWFRIGWTEILTFIVFFGSSFYIKAPLLQNDSNTRLGAIAPTISILAIIYATLSFSLMMVHTFSFVDDRMHWIIQIVIFIILLLSIITLSISRDVAIIGIEFDTNKAISPKKLSTLLAGHDSSLKKEEFGELKKYVKELKEIILFSFHESKSLSNSSDYQEFSQNVSAFCLSIQDLIKKTDISSEISNSLISEASKLITQARYIASD